MKMKQYEEIISQINERVEKPFVTAKFGDNWKEHQKRMLAEGQISIDMILDIAWKQGRRSLLMEEAIANILNENENS